MTYPQTQNRQSGQTPRQFKKSLIEHAEYWKAIKRFEQKFFAERGQNPNLPSWGAHPRAGATWSYQENLALVENFKDQVREDAQALGFKELCEIAYLHGRTATSVEAQLKKVLGWPTFYTYFQ